MEYIEYMTWETQLRYWEQKLKSAKLKLENAGLENDYWTLKIQNLKEYGR